ncbi:SH3 domain-containing protein [Streptomyces sp. NBC_01351]|uniref:SH3 domain-containing protein n=1 Tax=Streptomyces sp. NBC_01351 TaxID=2903833 RepID=UPI002E366487|nr:SH3 domain-containing protein [Streptomyces sp. NBC_01351]
MLKPTRTILALATGSLVLGLVGAGTAAAEDDGFQTSARTYGKVVSKGPLKVRSEPTTRSRLVGHLYPHTKVEIDCKKRGEKVDGNHLWYRLAEPNGSMENGDSENGTGHNGDWQNGDWQNGGGSDDRKASYSKRWVSARYVQNLGHVRYCR